jgi:glyoxylase-like metal-dependent hydrolase (beta-lactamase superfamily II)
VTAAIPYEVYALRYATVTRRAGENFIGGDPHESASTMDYFVWLVRNRDRTVVVDTGFNAAAAQARQRTFLNSPIDGLKALGVDAGRVEEVILTHLHYDHAGNFDRFPHATFHVQDRELGYATGRFMAQPFFAHSYAVEDVVGLVRCVYGGRVRFHDGDADIAPGLSVHRIGGHTMGLQVVRVLTRVGWLVLASDASHYYANMHDGRPFPIVYSVAEMIEGWQRMKTLADAPELIIPGHDPLVMKRYRAPGGRASELAVRLDAAPCD